MIGTAYCWAHAWTDCWNMNLKHLLANLAAWPVLGFVPVLSCYCPSTFCCLWLVSCVISSTAHCWAPYSSSTHSDVLVQILILGTSLPKSSSLLYSIIAERHQNPGLLEARLVGVIPDGAFSCCSPDLFWAVYNWSRLHKQKWVNTDQVQINWQATPVGEYKISR